jgi:ribosomal protein S18 acetylase RimI-like enzyme
MEAAWHGCYINDNGFAASMAKTLIRHALPADFNTLLEIDQSSFAAGIAYDATELSYFMNRNGAQTLVLEHDGEIAAFVIVEVERARRAGTIVTLDVGESYRRHGYGSRLLKRAEEILTNEGVEVCDLQVDVANRPAIAFYKKHGFRTVRTLHQYYANGASAYLMVKQLS